MIKFEKIKPGMVLYDVRKSSKRWAGDSGLSVWHVNVISVDADERTVIASWNGNAPRVMHERAVTKYREKLPRDA